ncbi:MAG: hypothetical protein O3A85_05575 [Proteobacteria bacterium]|nr:hypothetical protein [Pseudomonadota bacterium]
MPASQDRAIIIHSLADAKAAVTVATDLGLPITLRSAPGAAAYLGAQVFRDIIADATGPHCSIAVTAVFDCGDDPGLALGALRHGVKVIRISAPLETCAKIADIAAQTGARLERDNDEPDAPVLDLLESDDPEAKVRTWLAPRA